MLPFAMMQSCQKVLRVFFVVLFAFVLCCVTNVVEAISDISSDIAEATEGGQAKLPCNLAPLQNLEKPSLVSIFKGMSETVIYKYDLRGSRPQHWSEPGQETRYFLRVQENSDRAEFAISPIRLSDEDMYHCKVDFVRSEPRFSFTNLTVIGESIIILINKPTCSG